MWTRTCSRTRRGSTRTIGPAWRTRPGRAASISTTTNLLTGKPDSEDGMLREGRLIAVSPCLNDAVVSCAGLLAARPDSTVLTVYSGLPLAPEAGSAAD